MMERIEAPFTPEQVLNLNDFQRHGGLHPFTCATAHPEGRDLVATVKGWICPHCEYRQNWAHGSMADGSAVEQHRAMMAPLTTAAVPAEPSEVERVSNWTAFEMGRSWQMTLRGQTLEDARAVGRTLGCVLFKPIMPQIDAVLLDYEYKAFTDADKGIAQCLEIIERAFALAATPSQPAESSEGVECAISDIIRDVCELPGDDNPDGDDTLILTVGDLQLILERHLLPNQPAESEDRDD